MSMPTPETLYHYCTTEAFHSIIESRSVRLSSMSLSNDSLEGKLLSRALEKLAVSEGLNNEARSRITKDVSGFERAIDGLALCLSEQGDLLSQWRGYAGDATGLSIGFSKEWLDRFVALRREDVIKDEATEDDFFVSLHQVQYSAEEHEKEVRPIFEQARYFAMKDEEDPSLPQQQPELPEVVRTRGVSPPENFGIALLFLFYKMFILKSSDFQTECEWRLLSYSVRGVSDKAKFYPSGRKLVPYRSVDISRLTGAVKSVILGPRHETPPHVIQQFLAQCGFVDVEVKKSLISYR